MKREELGAVAVGALIGALIVVAIAYWTPTLAAGAYANAASNLLGILAGPSLVAAVALAAWRRWHTRCAVPLCVRVGDHPVARCAAKVCSAHHTTAHHERVFRLRYVPGGLGWGDSHALPLDEGDET